MNANETQSPTWSDRRRALTPWLAAYVATFTSRLLLIVWPPSGHLYNSDELEMAQASLDRFLGLPSTTLAWPGSLLLLLDTPLVAIRLAASALRGPKLTDLSGLSDGLGRAYMGIGTGVTELRILGALLASLAAPAAYFVLDRLGAHRRSAIFAALTVATIPLLWQQGAMATGDAASIGLAMVALAASVAGAPLLAGVAAGLALASKVTALGLALASLLVLVIAPRHLQRGSRWFAGAFISFLLACPYAWTDPIRMMKSTVGNFLRPGSGSGLPQIGSLLVEVMGWSWLPAVVLAALGIFRLFRIPERRGLAVALVVGLLLIVTPIARAGAVMPRYALGLATLLCVLAALGIDVLWNDQAASKSLRWSMVAAASLVALSIASAVRNELNVRKPDVVDTAIARLVAEGRGGDLFLPSSAELRMWDLMSKPHALELARHAEAMEADTLGAAAFMQRRGLSVSASRVLRSAFTEDESAVRGRLEAVASVAPDGPWSLHLYDPTDSDAPDRISIIEGSRNSAIAAFSQAPSPAALVLDRREPTLGTQAESLGAGWVLYRR